MNKKLIRKMLIAAGGPIYEEDWSDKWEPYAAKIGLAGDVIGLGTAATGVGIPVGTAIAGFANIPNLIIDGYQTARDTWRSFNDNGNSLGSAAWNGGELILDAAGLKALQYINKAAKAGVAPEKYLTSTEKALDSKPWKRVGTGHGRVRARQSADHKRKYNSCRNKALEESNIELAKRGVRPALGLYYQQKLTDEMAKRGYGVAVNDAIKSANRTLRQNLGIVNGVSGGTNLYHIFKKEKGGMLQLLKKGSGIHIKEKNKGKFTSYCGGKVTDECILKGKNSSNPAIRKRATFAANARKWKHQDGGIIIAEKGIKAGLKAKQNLTKRKAPDWDNLDRGYRYLTQDMKLPHDLAIAIMGNVVEESQGNYKAVLKNGGGRGLIQWDSQPAPTGRYGLWGKIWASVAKPANVYDSKTDTMKNYWAPWGGLKGEQVRLKFINAPLKTKTKIYAESYLRPGKPRIKDRQLSAMLLDSIYNPRIKNIIIDKEGGIIKALEGTKFNWQSALTNVGTNLFSSYLQSRVQNNKIDSEAEAAKAENEVDLNQYFWDIYLQELAKALLEEELKSKAISAMNDTVINSSPLVTLKIAYDKASKSYGNLKANLDARNKAIDAQVEAAKSSVITDAVSGVIQNGLGMLKDYYGSKNNNTSTTNTSITGNSNSYFDNYVNTKYKKFGTFNPDGSMNMLGGTFTIKDGYKPNQPQLFNYQPLKLNV